MKKVVLSLAVLFSMAMVSCGGNKAAEADSAAVDTMVETEVEGVIDSVAPDSAVAEVAAATDTVVAPVEEAK